MKNRITNMWDSIVDPALKAKVRDGEARRNKAFLSLLRKPGSQVSIQVLTHVHPFDGRKVYRHHVLFIGQLPALVIHSELVPR